MTQRNQTLTDADLRQFTGDIIRVRHPLNPNVIYTPGVQYLAEAGSAYWLVDAIAIWIGSEQFMRAEQDDPRIGYMHFWTLVKSPRGSATLHAKADSPDVPFIVQELEFTDFPLPRIDIWAAFDGLYWTLYLPSEH
jgi:hypothetical protein